MKVTLSIAINRWLLDHNIDGRVIYPAAEILQQLARVTQSYLPKAIVTRMQNATFDRFLQIEPANNSIEACFTVCKKDKNNIQATLMTSQRFKSLSASRLKQHANVHFLSDEPLLSAPLVADQNISHDHIFEIPSHRLYAELIPFGPSFQSVQGTVIISSKGASAKVYALDHPCASGPLGSPFPFDGSLHTACVWTQRYCGIVAFPIGFSERLIAQPIAPGETVMSSVIPVCWKDGIIWFNICLYDQDGVLRELIKGAAMKDVFGGRIVPPAWVCTRLKNQLNKLSATSIPSEK